MCEPTREQLAAVIDRAIRESAEAVRAVIAHGSWVRRDFWPSVDGHARRSDLDLIVVGTDTTVPDNTALRLQRDDTLGIRLDAWRISETELRALRARRPPGQPVRAVGNGIFDINGFDLVQHHRVVWGDPSADPLLDFPVPQGEDLPQIAVDRMLALKAEFVDHRFVDELNRVACDALKTAAIFFLIHAQRPPTRDKREIFTRFLELVPNFTDREATATAIWCLYEDGQRRVSGSDAVHRGRFIDSLVDIVQERGNHAP